MFECFAPLALVLNQLKVNKCHSLPKYMYFVVMHMYVAFFFAGAKKERLIPVLIEEAYRYKIPRTISHIVYLDYLRQEENNFWNRLARSLGWKPKWVLCCNMKHFSCSTGQSTKWFPFFNLTLWKIQKRTNTRGKYHLCTLHLCCGSSRPYLQNIALNIQQVWPKQLTTFCFSPESNLLWQTGWLLGKTMSCSIFVVSLHSAIRIHPKFHIENDYVNWNKLILTKLWTPPASRRFEAV